MDAVTYPDQRIQRMLGESFIPVKYEIESHGQDASRFGAFWTPTLLVLDSGGRIARRTMGFVPPDEMVGELHIGHGQYCLLSKRYEEAYEHFQRAVKESEIAAPEAMYWSGVAAYRRDGKPDGLMQHWQELQRTSPDSPWWRRASFIAG